MPSSSPFKLLELPDFVGFQEVLAKRWHQQTHQQTVDQPPPPPPPP